MPFPFYIQKAVDLGLLEADGDRITGCRKEEVETVLGVSRIIEKIQPTTAAEKDDTQDQEAIVLCRILTSPSGKARELWADLRCAVGIGHGQELPQQLWSCDSFRAVGTQIDMIYNGTANGASIINSQTLIESFAHSPTISVLEFNQSVTNLSQTATMRTYGDPESEWDVAIDLLRQARARATFKDAQHLGGQAMKSDTKLEKAIEAQQQELMTCLGMLRGSVGSQGNAVDAVEDLISPKDGRVSLIDQIMNAREQVPPISTGMAALDIDMEGGVRLPGQSAGGRLFTLAARTGVGKCSKINTPIIMADGSVLPVQDVKEGDLLLGPDGTPRRVYGLARGRSEMYRVTQQNGDSYTVNDAHILSLRVTGTKPVGKILGAPRVGGDIVNIEIKDYLQLPRRQKHILKGWKPEAVEFHGAPAYEGPLTPYLAGAYLGDGTARSAQLHLSDDEIIEEFRDFCEANGYNLKETANPGCTRCAISTGLGRGGNPVLNWIHDNDFVGQGKHIPDSLKRGSIQQRLEVLAGILDTDGYASSNCFDITLKEKRFADDVAFVARSLGLAANVQECQKSIKSLGFTGTYHRVTISGNTDKVPTRVARKQCGPRKQIKNVLNTGIKVESVGIDDYYGFALEGPDRLYLMGDFTVTHNTVLGVFAAINLARQGLEVGFVSAELDKAAIYARIWSAATHQCNPNTNWAEVGDIDSPSGNREVVSQNLMMAAGAIQQAGGKLLIEDPWGACVDAVINSMRSMKAKNPSLRAVVIDHFHCLARHKGAPANDSGMMEERAYKLMNAAKELEIDLIVLAQMNRVGMDSLSQKESPKLDQIRGTDALSHVSHAVWIVRKEMEGNGEERKWTGNLELWHSKTRGRQAMWKGNKITGLKQFVDKSILSMDYKYSSVKADYTNSSEGSSSSW
jgi:replicative DNA helicase